MTIAQELALGPTIAHSCTKRLSNTYLNEGMAKADAAMAEITKPIWTSEDLQRGLNRFLWARKPEHFRSRRPAS